MAGQGTAKLTSQMMARGVIADTLVDESSAATFQYVLADLCLDDYEDADSLLDASLRLTLAINDLTGKATVKMLVVLLRLAACNRPRILDRYVEALRESHLPVLPNVCVFFTCGKLPVGKPWWVCVRKGENASRFLKTLESRFPGRPVDNADVTLRIVLSSILPELRAENDELRLLLEPYRWSDELLAFLTSLENTRVFTHLAGYEGPIPCREIRADLVRGFGDLPGDGKVDLASTSVDVRNASSLTSTYLRTLVLRESRHYGVHWKGHLYVVPKKNLNEDTWCAIQPLVLTP